MRAECHEPIKRTVLVHGTAHGGPCWDRLVLLISERGYDVAAPDLPGPGDITVSSTIRPCMSQFQVADDVHVGEKRRYDARDATLC